MAVTVSQGPFHRASAKATSRPNGTLIATTVAIQPRPWRWRVSPGPADAYHDRDATLCIRHARSGPVVIKIAAGTAGHPFPSLSDRIVPGNTARPTSESATPSATANSRPQRAPRRSASPRSAVTTAPANAPSAAPRPASGFANRVLPARAETPCADSCTVTPHSRHTPRPIPAGPGWVTGVPTLVAVRPGMPTRLHMATRCDRPEAVSADPATMGR